MDSLLRGFGLNLPPKLMQPMIMGGKPTGAYFNLPGFLIVMILTVILVIGIRESAGANNFMVGVKLIAILVFIGAASRFIHVSNWKPFMPNGFQGVLTEGRLFSSRTLVLIRSPQPPRSASTLRKTFLSGSLHRW